MLRTFLFSVSYVWQWEIASILVRTLAILAFL
jgi:hypothetical protein